MSHYMNILIRNLKESIEAKQSLLLNMDQIESFSLAVIAVVRAYKAGGRLYIAGNGGSAADAQHLAAEFGSRLARNRPALAAEALTTDSSTITAIANDYGFENVFARQVECKMSADDVFLAITTSGRSTNINNALETCRTKGIVSILFGGQGGGASKKLAKHSVLVCGKKTSTIQEQHIVLAHSLCECVEMELFGSDD